MNSEHEKERGYLQTLKGVLDRYLNRLLLVAVVSTIVVLAVMARNS